MDYVNGKLALTNRNIDMGYRIKREIKQKDENWL